MSHHHPTIISVISRLRPTASDFAAAGALHDPSLLAQLHAAQPHRKRSR
jgi:hypothetical protein